MVENKALELTEMTTSLAHQLFADFKNDISLFKNKNEFEEYHYDANQVDHYVESKTTKGHILLAILYDGDVIGEIRFKHFEKDCVELGVVIKDDKYKNKGLGSIAISQGLDYAKKHFSVGYVYVKILKENKRSLHVFKKLEFDFFKETDDFIYLKKEL